MSGAQPSQGQPSESANSEFVFRSDYHAPRALMFSAWTDPEEMAEWWGLHGFTNTVCELDPPGAAIHLVGMEAGFRQSLERLADHLAQGGHVAPAASVRS